MNGTDGGGATGPEPTPAPEPSAGGPMAARRPLQRSRNNRWVAGVAGGLGEYFGVDPLLIRLLFACLVLFFGTGLALYLAAWLLLPLEGDERSVAENALRRARDPNDEDRSWYGFLVLAVIGIVVLMNFNWMGWGGSALLWAAALIGAGIWLFRQDTNRAESPGPAAPAEAAAAGAANAPAAAGSTTGTGRPRWSAQGSGPPPPQEPHSHPASGGPVPPAPRLGRFTFAAVLIALGLTAMLDNIGAFDVSLPEYGAVAMTVIGGGLVVGSFTGRPRGLIFWGLILLPFVLIGNRVDLPVEGGVGERFFNPTAADSLSEEHSLFAGKMRFDLTGMEWTEEPVRLDVSVGMGQVEVLVPEGVRVRFEGRVQLGEIQFFNRTREGTSVDLDAVEGGRAGGPLLILDTRVVTGQVDIKRVDTPARELS